MAKIVTFGEAMLRLSPPGHARLEQATQFDIHFGGAELNTAVALAQLGHDVEWVSAVPENALGRMLLAKANALGVKTTHVRKLPGTRLGLFFLEQGASPRAAAIEYDRANSAASLMDEGTFDWQAILSNTDWFHLSGITPAISATAARAASVALKTAKQLKVPVSFDPNFRAKLWSVESARAWYQTHLENVHLLFASAEDGENFYGVPKGEFPTSLAAKVPQLAWSTRGSGSTRQETYQAHLHAGRVHYESKTLTIDVIDRIGTGDAMAGGMIHGLLSATPEKAVAYAAVCGALKHTVPGDFIVTTPAEVEQLLQGVNLRVQR
jgi:2-dehydro-3-deoxygluconokinase